MTEEFLARVRNYATSIFRCGSASIHGLSHWRRVENSARLICKDTSADLMVVCFFAYLHDACRLNDGKDLQHGPRAADLLSQLPEDITVLNEAQLYLLDKAIRHHTEGNTSDDPTIGACWDADRLDLGRVGITPSDKWMSTKSGKKIAALGSKDLFV
jgi:uncharacterized protein